MRNNTHQLVLTAMFVALTLLLGLTPAGLIPLGFINVTILCVPVIVGTLLLGFKRGLILGACFGIASTLSMFGMSMTPPSALASALAAKSPLLAILMCMAPRMMIPVSVSAVYKLFTRGKGRSVKAVPFAAVAGSLTNTILYLGMMLWFYILVGLDASGILTLITGTALIAGGSEAVVAAVISGAVLFAIWKNQPEKTDNRGTTT